MVFFKISVPVYFVYVIRLVKATNEIEQRISGSSLNGISGLEREAEANITFHKGVIKKMYGDRLKLWNNEIRMSKKF